MSRGYNRVTLVGNLARDPDVRHTADKQAVARFTLAVGNEWKDRATGEKKGRTDFIPCQAWGALADVAGKYLAKGRPALVEGRMSVREYQGRDGGRKWATDVTVESLVLLGSPDRGRDGPEARPSPPPQRQDDGDFGDCPLDMPGFGDDYPLDTADFGGDGAADVPF